MLLKKIYKPANVDTPLIDIRTGEPVVDKVTGQSIEIDYIALAHTGIEPEQNFSTKLVVDFMKQGFIEIKDETLILHVHPEDLIYNIKRRPGRYCLHCVEKLPDDEKGELARLHILEKHKGILSPDPNNPSGYIALNHFECVLSAKQHEKFKVKKAAQAPSFFVKEVANG